MARSGLLPAMNDISYIVNVKTNSTTAAAQVMREAIADGHDARVSIEEDGLRRRITRDELEQVLAQVAGATERERATAPAAPTFALILTDRKRELLREWLCNVADRDVDPVVGDDRAILVDLIEELAD